MYQKPKGWKVWRRLAIARKIYGYINILGFDLSFGQTKTCCISSHQVGDVRLQPHLRCALCFPGEIKKQKKVGQRGNTKQGKSNNIGHIGEGKWASDTEAQKVQKVSRVHRLRSTFKSVSLCPLNWSPMVSIASAQILSFRYPKTSAASVQKK